MVYNGIIDIHTQDTSLSILKKHRVRFAHGVFCYILGNYQKRMGGVMSEKLDKATNKTTKKTTKATKKTTKKKKNTQKELNAKQELFCQYFTKSLNATQSYKKAYNCSYEVAEKNSYKIMGNYGVREKITALKKEKAKSIMLNKDDIVDKYMRIAFADITDFVDFGREKVDIMTMFGPMEVKNKETGEKETVQKEVNTIKFKEHGEVDGTIISQIKVSKDGASIKLEDRMKALEWLANYFILDPMSQHKMEYDKRKIDIELIKAESQLAKNTDNTESIQGDDGFIKALNTTTSEVWDDAEEDE